MKLILDTNVYIEASLSQEKWKLFEQHVIPFLPFVHLSAVVAFELSLSQKKDQTYFLLKQHIESMKKVERWITPLFDDWLIASRFLKEKKLRSQLCDALIGCSARRIGAVVLTLNMKDFLPLSKAIDFQVRLPW